MLENINHSATWNIRRTKKKEGWPIITKVFIHKGAADLPETRAILSRIDAPRETVDDERIVYRAVEDAEDPIDRGKKILFLTGNRGRFLRDCPGTSHYTCCGYKILHVGTFCVMDCSYCILQSYFHPPLLRYFVNHEDLFAELREWLDRKEVCRIGTGEFTDSLIWDRWTDLSTRLVQTFSGQSSCVLELKTKTAAINRLKNLEHNRKTILAWSLNTESVIRSEERGTASLSKRLDAAAKCESLGYPLAFHFDPMVIYDGCENDYIRVVEKLFSKISARNIAWISLGAFRFMPSLKQIIQNRFRESKIVYGEFIAGLDGKSKYFKPLRIELYKKIGSVIKEVAPGVTVYFCMEDDEVWKKSLNFTPSERGGLEKMLDESAARVCGLSL